NRDCAWGEKVAHGARVIMKKKLKAPRVHFGPRLRRI
ncbi:hypothetical protein A2U01_0116450, partial [Trifolium medium]|nr:hypothetical protein [Trifolium medium]